MQLSSVNFGKSVYNQKISVTKNQNVCPASNEVSFKNSVTFEGVKNYLPNVNYASPSFKGACNNLKKLQAFSPEGKGYVMKKSSDGSYLVDGETATRIYYGKDAQNFIEKNKIFKNDTQVICPHDGELLIKADGKEIPIKSNGAVVIGKGKEAEIKVIKGNPLVVTSEREPVWYDKYGTKTTNKNHRQKFDELAKINFHLYDGHLKVSNLGENITDKLINSDLAEYTGENHIKLKKYYAPKFQEKIIKRVLDENETAVFNNFYETAWKVRTTTKEAKKAMADGLNAKTKDKMIKNDMIYDLSKTGKNQIYWKQVFSDEFELEVELKNLNFDKKEQKEIIKFWKQTNKFGFDFTGIKYLSDNIAVYSLEDKLNNWNGARTEWNTHSNAAVSVEEGAFSPYIGVSEVYTKKNYTNAVPFKKVRNEEILHSHPAQIDKRQTEIYMITEGAGAITVIENNKPKVITLKAGEGIIIQPGVKHCMSAAKGQYEHLVCQIPSTFQYGFEFKIGQQYPDGYSESKVNEMALEKLNKVNLK